MAKVTFVIGLCGSGKTYLSERLAAQNRAELFEGIVGKREVPRLLECLNAGKNCVVEEISYCLPEYREGIIRTIQSVAPATKIEWLCYANDLDAANWNVRHRTNKREAERHMEINGRVHRQYVYPDGSQPLPITRLRVPCDDIVELTPANDDDGLF